MNTYEDIINKKQLYMSGNLMEPNKTKVRKEISETYNNFPTSKKRGLIEMLYPVLRDNISAAFTSNNYQEIIDSFKEIENTKRWRNELLANKIIMSNMLIFGYLFLHLEQDSNDKSYFSKAIKLFEKISDYNLYDVEFNEEQLKNELKLYKKNEEFIKAINNNNIWTEIIYEIPFPMYISDKEIFFEYNEVVTILNTKIINNKEQRINIGDGFVCLDKDAYGLLNRTLICLKINKYLSPNNDVKIYNSDTIDTRSQAVTVSLKVLNHIIKHYRLISGDYWLSNVSYKMIKTSSIKVFANKVEIKDILFSDENKYMISNKIPYLPDESIERLQTQLSDKRDTYLWRVLLLDAKRYLTINNLRESIILLNSSFENFIYSNFKILLKKFMGEAKSNCFFQGHNLYVEHPSSKVISEEQFNELSKLKIINNSVPSVYQLVKMYYKHVPEEERINLTKKEFNSIVHKIKDNRNDIIHGNEVRELSSGNVQKAIKSYEKLIKIIVEKHFKK